MPCICQFSRSKVYMYADDHAPPHFHLIGIEWEAVVSLSTLTVLRGDAPGADLREAIQWADQNRQFLADMWSTLNERDV